MESKTLAYHAWLLSEHKAIEVQVMFNPYQYGVGLLLNRYVGDHAGWEVELYLPFLWMHVHFYDTRHAEEES